MADESKLLQKAETIKSLLRDLTPKRKATVHTLRVLADELLTHHNNVCIAHVTANSTSIAGFGAMAAGFGLSFFTGGISLVVSAVGSVLSAAGGVANAGSSVAEVCIQRGKFDTAQKIINEDQKAAEAIEELWKEFEEESKKILKGKSVKTGVETAFLLKDCAMAGIHIGAEIGAEAATEGGEVLFRSLDLIDKVVQIGGLAVSAVFLPFQIKSLVTNSKEIDAARKGKNDKEPEAVKKLRQLADQLEKDMHDKNELFREIDDLVSMTTAQDSNPLEAYL